MNTEVYDTRIVSGNYMAYSMNSGNMLYTEHIPGQYTAYTLSQPDGQGLTWHKPVTQGETWEDRLIRNAVNNETNLNRLAQLLNTFGVESHWCNHVEVEESIRETTMDVIVPIPQDGDDTKLPPRIYAVKSSDTGLTWVHIYKWVDMRTACDPTDAMNVIRDNERKEQA